MAKYANTSRLLDEMTQTAQSSQAAEASGYLGARILTLIEPGMSLPSEANEKLGQLLDYWRDACNGRPIPARKDIDPLSIPRLLTNIFILDVEDGEVFRFRFRLVGEIVNERYGGRLKGATLNELLTGDRLNETLEEHRVCLEKQVPVYTRNTAEAASVSDDFQLYHRLIMPLGGPDAAPSAILGMMQFDRS